MDRTRRGGFPLNGHYLYFMSEESKAVLTAEGPVQQYIAYIAEIPEADLWPDGVTPVRPFAVWSTRDRPTIVNSMMLGMVDRDHLLDRTATANEKIRADLAWTIRAAVAVYDMWIRQDRIPEWLRGSRLVADPANTTLVAYVPGERCHQIRDLPQRLGFSIAVGSSESHPPAQ